MPTPALPAELEVMIHGQKWTIRVVPRSKLTDYRKGTRDAGQCVVPERPRHKLSRRERIIWISKSLSDEDMLETVTHEVMHAAFPSMNEEWVNDTAEDIKNILWAFGYRREGANDGSH